MQILVVYYIQIYCFNKFIQFRNRSIDFFLFCLFGCPFFSGNSFFFRKYFAALYILNLMRTFVSLNVIRSVGIVDKSPVGKICIGICHLIENISLFVRRKLLFGEIINFFFLKNSFNFSFYAYRFSFSVFQFKSSGYILTGFSKKCRLFCNQFRKDFIKNFSALI